MFFIITIGICDDEQKYRDILKRYVTEYFKNVGLPFNIVEFASAEDLMIYNGGKIHLLFLDIMMDGMSGIEVLPYVESRDMFWRVVFTSSYTSERWNTMGMKTLGFIDKPVQYKPVEKCLEITVKENIQNRMIEFASAEGKAFTYMEDIYSVEANKNYVKVCGKDKDWIAFDTMKRWEEMTKDTTIIRVHKSFLINIMHVYYNNYLR